MKKILNTIKKCVILTVIWQAKIILKKYKPKVVAITGSVGKTSTKDAVYTVLSKFHYVRKSDKNFNTNIGIALTVLGVPSGKGNIFVWLENVCVGFYLIIFRTKYPKWMGFEMGTGKPGDIKELTNWIKPDVAII